MRASLWIFLFSLNVWAQGPCEQKASFTLVIHGGAGNWNLSASQERKYRETLQSVLNRGYENLREGGRGVDVVEVAISMMEDSVLFNAGKGAIKNEDGEFELDASIMDGRNANAGAVAAVKTIKNPVQAARKVMDNTRHVFLVAAGADRFAKKEGVAIVEQSYFEKDGVDVKSNHEFGTVGAVVWDRCGDLAAATSTGGYKTKIPGRVGDSPIIGAGNYANNKTCAVSGTGHGEYFMRHLVTYDISARMQYRRESLADATKNTIKHLGSQGGKGGVIAVDAKGNIATPYNTGGMARGWVTELGKSTIKFR